MNGLPMSCLRSCLLARKVAYFACRKSHPYFRQLSMKGRSGSGVSELPATATIQRSGNRMLPDGCLKGCLNKGDGPWL